MRIGDDVNSRTAKQQISFADPDVHVCPFAAYDQLRDEQPVYRDPRSGNYVLTRYEDIRKALLNVAVFSSRAGVLGDRWCPEANRMFAEHGWLPMDTLTSNDPPSHRTYRTLVDKAFTPAKVVGLEPRIAEIINELIDGFIDREETDFVEAFSVPLPMYVIAEQLGVAREDRGKFKSWSDAAMESTSPVLTPERQVELARQLIEMQQYMAGQIDRVRGTPDEKLLSRIANLEVDGRMLDKRELQSLLLQILVAGNETTTTTLASGMKFLIDQPQLAEAIYRDPERAKPFVEETLRIVAPLQTMFRKALANVDIGGVTIPAGALVEVRFGAANRDPRQYSCPAEFDLDRKNANTHLSFGAGIHACIGNQLARSELRLAFQVLTRRLKDFRTTRGEASYQWMRTYTAYGLRQLWMTFSRR